MNSRTPSRFASTLTVAALTLCAPAVRAQTYHLTDLGVLPGQSISKPAGINNAGQVAGVSGPRAVRFTNGVVEDLSTLPGGTISTGIGINDVGQVVGDSEFQNGGSIRRAALFTNGQVVDLGSLPNSGNYSRALGINQIGEVVGHSGPQLSTSNTRAFLWDATNGMRDLGTLGGQYAAATSINDAGLVTGSAQLATGFGASHAFLWDAVNGMRDIGVIGGNTSSGAFVNNHGHVAGTSTINGFDNRQHAFLYDGTMHDLGAIGNNHFLTDRSQAYGINLNDEVVGTTYRPYTGGALIQIAFVHLNGQMLDLETLVDASGADYRLYVATGINDAGQIAVEAIKISTNQLHAVRLDPNSCTPPVTYCSAKVNSAGCTPAIASTGTPSATAGSGFMVSASQVLNNKSGLLFYGTNGRASTPFQAGILCVKPPVHRTRAVHSGGNPPPNDCSGVFTIDMNLFAAGGLGGAPSPALSIPGTGVNCQWWGRDPGFAAPNGTMLSNGLEYVICP